MPRLFSQRRYTASTIDAMMPNFTFTRTLTEGAIGTDTMLKSTQRTLSEGAIGTDTFASAKVRPATFTEGLINTDTILKATVRVLTEGAIGTDTILKASVRVLTEGMIGTDTFSRTLAKAMTFTEGIIGTDILRKLKNGTDVIWTHITKSASATFTKITKAATTWTHINRS